MIDRQPNVLVVGPSPFNHEVGGGVTLSALFDGWRHDGLAQIYNEETPLAFDVCERFYPVVARAALTGPRAWRQVRKHLAVWSGNADTALFLGRPSRRLRAWVAESPPDIVLCHLASIPIAQIAMSLARRWNARLATYVPDDWMPGWPANIHSGANPVFNTAAHLWLDLLVERLVRRSALHFGISEAMREEYLERYGVDFEPVYNGVDLSSWAPRGPHRSLHDRRMRVVYSGSLFEYGGRAALADACEAVARLRADGIDVVLDIYSRHADVPELQHLFDRPPACHLRSVLPTHAFHENLQSADVLLLPVNFDTRSKNFLRLSMPGKLAEYLASGTPILAYGPVGTAQEQLLRRAGAAELVVEQDVSAVAAALRRLHGSVERRAELSLAGRSLAERVFDVTAIRHRFQTLLSGAPPAR